MGRWAGRVGLGALPCLMAVVIACSSAPSGRDRTGTAPTGSGARDPVVFLVSVDGLVSYALNGSPDDLPTFSALLQESAATLQARSAHELTTTLPNHAAMLTGRRINGPRGTGVVVNDDPGGTMASLTGRYVPGVFDVAHDHGVPTGFYTAKAKFGLLTRSWDRTHGAPDLTGEDDGRAKLDVVEVGSSRGLTAAALHDAQTARVRLAFIHLAAADLAGHRAGWLSAEYRDALRLVDREIATLVDGIRADADLRDRSWIVLTSDHGGSDGGHHRADVPANYTVPFLVWGPGVDRGDLYRLDPGRRNPGVSRPTYAGAQPVRNLDAANVTLGLLDLPLLPFFGDEGPAPLQLTRD